MAQPRREPERKLSRKEKFQRSKSSAPSEKVTKQAPFERYARLIICGVVLLVFGNTLSNQYVLDDFSILKDNFLTTRGFSGIAELWKTSYRYGYLSIQDGLYRPLTMTLFAFQWELFPDNPFFGHFINLILYGTGLLVLHKLLLCFFPGQSLLALLVTLLFAVHPIHTEVVANIKSADELLSFLFGVSSLYFVKTSQTIRSYVLAFFCMLCGLFSKEGTVAFTGIIVALFMVGLLDRKRLIAGLTLFIAATIIYLLSRQAVLDSVVGLQTVSKLDNPLANSGLVQRIPSGAALLFGYLIQLIYPFPLIYDYSYPAISPYNWTDWNSITGLILIITISIWAFWKGKQQPLLSLSWWIFLCGFALYSNIPFLIGAMRAERFIFLSSFGFCLALGFGIYRINRNWMMPISAFILIALSTVSFARNSDWYSNETLYRTDLEKQPNSAKVYYYLGNELIKTTGPSIKDTMLANRVYREGISVLKKSLQLYPGYADALTQTGVGYFKLNVLDSASKYFYKTLEINRNNPTALSNLGSVLFNQGKYKDAISIYQECLSIDQNFVDAWLNLGSSYGMLADYEEALRAFDRCLSLRPDHTKALEFKQITLELIKKRGR